MWIMGNILRTSCCKMNITAFSDSNLYSSKVEFLIKCKSCRKEMVMILGEIYCHCRGLKWEFWGTWSRPCTFSAKPLGRVDHSAKRHLKLLTHCIRVRAKTNIAFQHRSPCVLCSLEVLGHAHFFGSSLSSLVFEIRIWEEKWPAFSQCQFFWIIFRYLQAERDWFNYHVPTFYQAKQEVK